jgi:saccharopine dehydrogenase (NAD+, L-glutamate forming)
MISEVAICLAREVSADDVRGGFWTPATAMGARLIESLEDNAGLTFSVVE